MEAKNKQKLRKKLHEILDIVLDINGIQGSRAGAAGNHPTVFMDFLGHIGELYFSIHKNGWDIEKNPDESWNTDILSTKELNSVIRKLKKLKEELADETNR